LAFRDSDIWVWRAIVSRSNAESRMKVQWSGFYLLTNRRYENGKQYA